MASVRREISLDLAADRAWSVLGDFGKAAVAFKGVLVDCRRDGDVRTVTFANGLVAKERLVAVDDGERRIVYTVEGGSFAHHNSSMRIVAAGRNCTFVWITDVLPHEAAERILPLVEEGCRALKRNLESGAA